MKILHVALLLSYSPGIVQQMGWEHEVARDLNIPWDVRIYSPDDNLPNSSIFVKSNVGSGLAGRGLIRRVCSRMNVRREYFKWLDSIVDGYDLILLRHNVYSLSQAIFLAKHGRKIITVHHTLEVPELRLGPKFLRREVYAFLEKILGFISISLAKGILGVTREIINYENKRSLTEKRISLVYPNGIIYDRSSFPGKCDRSSALIPEILFVASSFVAWHGLDLLLNSIRMSSQKFVLHLVGGGISSADMDLIKEDSRIFVHGCMEKGEISNLAVKCHVGLGSLALHRVGMEEACTLKVREYLFNGLPVYSSHRDVFPETFPYYKCGPADIEEILKYASEVSSIAGDHISDEAEKYISKRNILSSLYGSLCADAIE